MIIIMLGIPRCNYIWSARNFKVILFESNGLKYFIWGERHRCIDYFFLAAEREREGKGDCAADYEEGPLSAGSENVTVLYVSSNNTVNE